ncbi:hypothetical protein NL676_020633 [Syzygium grande]|nr:hypothetical protein NL676_020633 [Syzygium grande]
MDDDPIGVPAGDRIDGGLDGLEVPVAVHVDLYRPVGGDLPRQQRGVDDRARGQSTGGGERGRDGEDERAVARARPIALVAKGEQGSMLFEWLFVNSLGGRLAV